MEEILVKKHESQGKITYPVKCLPPELFSHTKLRNGNNDLIDWSEVESYHWSEVEAYRETEFGVTHVEALEIPERYVRGIVTYKGQEYVFTARACLMTTMNKIDMTVLIENVINEIKEISS
jgi:hypothetical protein